MQGVAFPDLGSVHIDDVIVDLNQITANGDRTFQKNLRGVERIVEGNDLSAWHSLQSRQPPVGKRNLWPIKRLVPEKMVAHQDRALHGSRGHHRSLANESAHQKQEQEDPQRPLAGTEKMSALCFALRWLLLALELDRATKPSCPALCGSI